MNETKKLYKAFGLVVESCFPIAQIPEVESGEPDVRIVRADLSGLPKARRRITTPGANYIRTWGQGVMRVTGGNLIEVDPSEDASESFIGVYLMGSCMGAILCQRGFMLLHGSCVTDGTRSILITGDSGAGKSTMAAEFLKRDWKLLTDDVATVFDADGIPMVQSSYPSQKLWQDALDRYEKPEHSVHTLYSMEAREKFGINVASSFYDGAAPLSMVVRLLPDDRPCSLTPMEGMTKVDQLLRNTYRIKLIEQKDLQRHFQRCVTLSTKLPMALAIRENGKQCAETLYELITDYLGGMNHD